MTQDVESDVARGVPDDQSSYLLADWAEPVRQAADLLVGQNYDGLLKGQCSRFVAEVKPETAVEPVQQSVDRLILWYQLPESRQLVPRPGQDVERQVLHPCDATLY